ncbi:hypothetical protein [Rhodoplanes azumiensis]|uniref:Uncharacterized protein n=1 Tax=Rhodoplanes azumiensis TaxID=1897628 RepID=A0ABW5AF23_9BRAD
MVSSPLRASLLATAVLFVLGAVSAVAGDAMPAAGERTAGLGWTEVGPPTARFAPAAPLRLGTLQATDLLGPVTLVRPARPYDLEAFSPHLTGTPQAPATAIADPLYGKAPLMAQGVE